MTVLIVLLALHVAAALAYWLWQAYAFRRTQRDVPRLEKLDPPEPAEWPRLSIIVPARNEAETIEPALQTLLAEDYPDLEIVLVDDRSEDGTGAVMDRAAAGDERVRALHITELPEGWLGKVHALQQGLEASSGALVLFTDADVHFARGTLRRAVAHMLAESLDHLAALPRIRPTSAAVDAAVSAFLRQFISASRPWLAGRADSRACFGVGAFNLVRRAAFDQTEGLQWLRMEVGDDMGVGMLMKRAGKRSAAVSAFDHVALRWQTSLAQMARNAEKGYGSVCHFSIVRTLLLAAVSTLLELSPVAALVPVAWPATRAVGYAGIAVAAAFLVTVALIRRWYGGSVLPMLLGPLAAPVSAAMMVRAAVLGKRRGGAAWRGTLYTEAQLRAGLRIRFP
jgi:hypothetical protein